MTHEPELAGQTVVVIGGSAGIGLETARAARAEGADVIVTARNEERLQEAGRELGADIAAFDATDFDRLGRFFDELAAPVDHVLVTGPGPYYAPLSELDFDEARRDVEAHLMLPLHVARNAVGAPRAAPLEPADRARRRPGGRRRAGGPADGQHGRHRCDLRHRRRPAARRRLIRAFSRRGGR